ncbi:MAG: hypothetical protein ABIV63_09640 [Caldimonas sp.]
MTRQSRKDWVHFVPPARSGWEQGEWLQRCQVEINAREPLLGADDVLSLASDLWDRPDCQLASPDLAVGLLFTDQLRCLSCASHKQADFSVLCESVKTDRCPTKRSALHSSHSSTGY